MYIGHYGVAFALRSRSPDQNSKTAPSLGALFFAVQLLDILFGILAFFGAETVHFEPGPGAFPYIGSFPWSHSLLGATAWSFVFGGLFVLRNRRIRDGVVIALAVFSHWILDFISHTGDMRIWPHGEGYGLELSRSLVAIVFVELALFLGGLTLYVRSGAKFDRLRLAKLTAFLILSHGVYVMPMAHTADLSMVPLMSVFFAVLAIWASRVEN